MIYAPGRYYRGMPDALCWQKHSWDDPYQRLAAAAKDVVAFSHACWANRCGSLINTII